METTNTSNPSAGQQFDKKGNVIIAFHNNPNTGKYSVLELKYMPEGNVLASLSSGTKGQKDRQKISISLSPFEVTWLEQVAHGMATKSVLKKIEEGE